MFRTCFRSLACFSAWKRRSAADAEPSFEASIEASMTSASCSLMVVVRWLLPVEWKPPEDTRKLATDAYALRGLMVLLVTGLVCTAPVPEASAAGGVAFGVLAGDAALSGARSAPPAGAAVAAAVAAAADAAAAPPPPPAALPRASGAAAAAVPAAKRAAGSSAEEASTPGSAQEMREDQPPWLNSDKSTLPAPEPFSKNESVRASSCRGARDWGLVGLEQLLGLGTIESCSGKPPVGCALPKCCGCDACCACTLPGFACQGMGGARGGSVGMSEPYSPAWSRWTKLVGGETCKFTSSRGWLVAPGEPPLILLPSLRNVT